MGETLLVVARDRALQFAVESFFTTRKVGVDVCASAREALTLVDRRHDALLVDHEEDDETALVRILIAACRAHAATVVVLTGADATDAFDADAIRMKPLPLGDLAVLLKVGVGA